VGSDLFDDFDGFGPGVVVGRGFGEVEAGDLESVEEEAGAAGVDVVGGDAAEDFSDGNAGWRNGLQVTEGRRRSGGLDVAGDRRRVFGWCGGSSRDLLRAGRGCRSDGRR
jgi:hypothetical protein